MHEHVAPALFAVFIWWLGTGVVLYLDNLPERTYGRTLLGTAIALAVSLAGLLASADDTDTVDAYLAFACGVALWGCLELSYFMGMVTGPRKAPCPPGCPGWQRFALAIGTSLWHELSVVATGVLLFLLCEGEPNRIGVWTFAVLWLMRWSAKLNVFLGVPNLNADWLPEHLRFLKTYMGRRPMNLLFPFSVTAGTVVSALLGAEAAGADTDQFTAVGLTLVTTLLALAVLEHWLLVLPLPDEALWAWAFQPRQKKGKGRSEAQLRTKRRLQAQQS